MSHLRKNNPRRFLKRRIKCARDEESAKKARVAAENARVRIMVNDDGRKRGEAHKRAEQLRSSQELKMMAALRGVRGRDSGVDEIRQI